MGSANPLAFELREAVSELPFSFFLKPCKMLYLPYFNIYSKYSNLLAQD